MRTYHKDGTLPQNGEIFVFGSNLAGRHGAGAAKVAKEKFGAAQWCGQGMLGRSYAIPTKDGSLIPLELETIQQYIYVFLAYATQIESQNFFITRIGCGLAGYKDSEIAPMFELAPNNCSFAEEWKEWLE